jgi:hypothetical protein
MRAEGWSNQAIAGQVHQWHPTWGGAGSRAAVQAVPPPKLPANIAKPTPADKYATVAAREMTLGPQDLKMPSQQMFPARGAVPKGAPFIPQVKATLDRRFNWATRSMIPDAQGRMAAHLLAVSAQPDVKRRIANPAYVPPAVRRQIAFNNLPWYQRLTEKYDPIPAALGYAKQFEINTIRGGGDPFTGMVEPWIQHTAVPWAARELPQLPGQIQNVMAQAPGGASLGYQAQAVAAGTRGAPTGGPNYSQIGNYALQGLDAPLKMGVAGAGAIQQLSGYGTEPIWKPWYGMAKGALSAGTGIMQAGGLLVGAPFAKHPLAMAGQAGQQLAIQQAQDFWRRFGGRTSYGQAYRLGEKQPGTTLMWDLAAADLAAKGAITGAGLLRGLSPAEAWTLTHTPEAARTLEMSMEGGVPKPVEIPLSHSPLARLRQRYVYDPISKTLQRVGAERVPVVRRMTESSRAVRQFGKQMARVDRRRLARIQGLATQVRAGIQTGLFGTDRDLERRLALFQMKPKGMDDATWESAIINDVKAMMNGRPFQEAELAESPAAAKLRAQVESYESRAALARDTRRQALMQNIGRSQTRLANTLHELVLERDDLYDEARQVESDPALSTADRQEQLGRLTQQMRVHDSYINEVHQELSDITVDQTPIEHPARDAARAAMEQVPSLVQGRDEGLAQHAVDLQNAHQRLAEAENALAGVAEAYPAAKEGFLNMRRANLEGKVEAAYDDLQHLERMGPADPIEAMLAVGDTRDRVLQRSRDVAPGDWWARNEFRFVRAEDIPSQALYQIRNYRNAYDLAERYPHYARAPRGGVKPLDRTATAAHIKRSIAGAARMTSVEKDPAKLTAMFREAHRLAEKGARFRQWYRFSGDSILDHVHGDKEEGYKLAQLLAIYSANRDVPANTVLAMRAYDQARAGLKISEGSEKQIETANRVMAGHPWEGRKTNSFFSNMLQYIDPKKFKEEFPTAEDRARATVDVWMNRMFGFKGKAPTDAQYTWVQDHIRELARQLGWKPDEVQAASWVALKAETEGTSLEKAAYDFGHGIDTHNGTISFEAPPEVRGVISPEGRNLINEAAGVPGAGSHLHPDGTVSHSIPMLRTKGPTGDYVISKAERRMAEQAAAAHGFVLNRDKVAFGRVFQAKAVSHANAIQIRLPEGMTGEARAAIANATGAEVVHAPEGAWLLKPPKADPTGWVKQTEAALKSLDPTLEQNATAVVHDGGVVRSDDYTRHLEAIERRNPGAGQVLLRLRGDVARASGDPAVAAEAEARAAEGAAAQAAGGVTRYQHHPAIEGAIKGAMQRLDDTPGGRRIIYLTQHADVSTVLHEMVGHAADEMKAYHPQEFAEVEKRIGRPLEQWTNADHEQLAEWAERYFRDGLAPTPELVPIMERIKTWMKAIYGGLSRRLGLSIPLATKTLFDAYFGAYDDVNAFRVAAAMHEGPILGADEAHLAGTATVLGRKLAGLEKRAVTIADKKTIEGMQERMLELKNKGAFTPEEEAEYYHLDGKLNVAIAKQEIREAKRQVQLRGMLSELERSREKAENHPAFQGAQKALAELAEYREEVLREVFGEDHDETFSNRKDLLADWLVQQGFLRPESFERGTAHYFPMQMTDAVARRNGAPSVPVSPVKGVEPSAQYLNLAKRNNMILYQNGDWSADPTLLVEAAKRAGAFQHAHDLGNLLWELGREVPLADAMGAPKDAPKDVYVFNKGGTPIDPHFRAVLDDLTTPLDVQRAHDAIDGGSDAATEASVRQMWLNRLIDPHDAPTDFHMGVDGLRYVDKAIVHALFQPLNKASSFGKIADVANTLARWSLIYSNFLGYSVVNGIGNMSYLLAQQGWKLPMMMGIARRLLNDPELQARIDAETGEHPAEAMIARGGDYPQRFAALERRAMRRVTTVDRIPRRIGWIYEARKLGYKSRADWNRLLDGATAKTARDRELVAERTAQHSVDFDRLSPWERQKLTRLFFVYPWVRGATAYPFWYASNFPARAALAMSMGQQLEQRRETMLRTAGYKGEATPPWYEGMTPVQTSGIPGHERALVVPAAPISPIGTSLQTVETLRDTVMSLFGQKPNNLTMRLADTLVPWLRDANAAGMLQTSSGQAQSLGQIAAQSVTALVPGMRLYQSLANPGIEQQALQTIGLDRTAMPKVYTQDDMLTRFEHTFLRLFPEEISIPRLNAQAVIRGTPTVSQQLNDAYAKTAQEWGKITSTTPLPQEAVRGVKVEVLYRNLLAKATKTAKAARGFDPAVQAGGESFTTTPKVTPYIEAKLYYKVVKSVWPQLNLPPPEIALVEPGGYGKPNIVHSPNSGVGQVALGQYLKSVRSAVTSVPSGISQEAKAVDIAKLLGVTVSK